MGRAGRFYSELEAELLLEMIRSREEKLIFYDSGHRLPGESVAAAREWLERYLS